jgi:hypothetical protein
MLTIEIPASDIALLSNALAIGALSFMGPFPLCIAIYSILTKSEDQSLTPLLPAWIIITATWLIVIAVTFGQLNIVVVE